MTGKLRGSIKTSLKKLPNAPTIGWILWQTKWVFYANKQLEGSAKLINRPGRPRKTTQRRWQNETGSGP